MFESLVIDVQDRFDSLEKSQLSLIMEVERLNAELEMVSANCRNDRHHKNIEKLSNARKRLTVLIHRLKNINSRSEKLVQQIK